MKLLKKKSPPKVEPKRSLVLAIDELPTKALSITYKKFYSDYEKEQDSTQKSQIHQKLILISKILTDRAYEDGNGELKKQALTSIPGLTSEQFDSFPRDKKEKLKKYLEQKQNLDRIAQELTTSQPDKIEFEMPVQTPAEMKTHSEHVTVEERKPTHSTIETDRLFKEPKKKKGFLAKLNQPVFEKEENEKGMFGLEYKEKPKKQKNKKPAFAFLKKKKKKQIEIPISDELTQTIDKIQTEEPKLFQKPATPEQKERARKMEIATKLKFGGFKKKEDPTKPSMKGLEEVYCHVCKHSIKSHQKGGQDTGCNKCGCLIPIAEIAKKSGINLQKPKQVLEKIERENIQPAKEYYAKSEDVKVEEEIPNFAKKQAEKLATMAKKPKEKTIEEEIQEFDDEIKELDKKENQKVITETQCICDHQSEDHYNANEFCQVKGCLCSEFKPYPK